MSSDSSTPSKPAAPLPKPRDPHLFKMANCIRMLSIDAVQKANSGHPGMPMGMADIATVLFSEFLKFDPSDPHWMDRDRFIISNGHGSMLLYSLLHLTGYADMTMDQLERFRQVGSKTAGHPEYLHATGIETTTGPLGQGIATSVGMALGEHLMAAQFGDALVDHYTYVFCGDGCLMEGVSHEAISLAGHYQLGKLIVFFDHNNITIDGSTDLSVSDDQIARVKASGWHTQEIDGHDTDAIRDAIKKAQAVPDQPSFISCRTIIGFGMPTRAGTSKAHSDAPGEEEIKGTRDRLGWDAPPFVIPDDLAKAWLAVGARGKSVREGWLSRVEKADASKRDDFKQRIEGKLPGDWKKAIAASKKGFLESGKELATRAASGAVLGYLVDAIPAMVGGSADLTPSNNTKTKDMVEIKPEAFDGRYIHFGVREHGMAAALNGLALHGGLIPYGGTFMCFSDYCKPAIRLAAMMKIRSIFVMTHDSIGLGEDGPTHQPVEHLAGFRAIPNLAVYRPADAIETAEAWECTIANAHRPSFLALSRQALPLLRKDAGEENKTARGAYVLKEASSKRRATILSSGSEVQLAIAAQTALEQQGIPTAVVSMPCWLLFEEQDASYKDAVLGKEGVTVAAEAAVELGWGRYIGRHGGFIGMHSFGESGKAPEVYKKFGITSEAVTAKVKELLGA
jgi:transketolase